MTGGKVSALRMASLGVLTVLLTACAGGVARPSPASTPGSSAPRTGAAAPAAPAVNAAVAPAALTGPAVGSFGGGRLDLFYRSSRDGSLAHQSYAPGPLATWTAAQSLGGTLTSQPAVASWAPGRYDVFARGTG